MPERTSSPLPQNPAAVLSKGWGSGVGQCASIEVVRVPRSGGDATHAAVHTRCCAHTLLTLPACAAGAGTAMSDVVARRQRVTGGGKKTEGGRVLYNSSVAVSTAHTLFVYVAQREAVWFQAVEEFRRS